ncbi:glycosyltransferase family 2 protein [Actinomycetospora chiangmaiensis]|uniref:glycosyltransferase family 2 protein n=1 Tax=Actinomycetospora chiangmaiensis TaxID=402650 RepID=UPI000373849B|nr:glycosyltransferase [Actinomycetospora chiangmaiensis]
MTTPAPSDHADRAALATSAVVVCAYTERRWDDVRAAIASLAAQTHRPDQVLLVVDHNPELAVRARGFFGAPVQVLENRRRRGLSGARNTAIDELAESVGGLPEIVAFLDDDAAARPDWLARILAPFEDPAVAAVGGAAAPRWSADDPRAAAGAPAVLPPELWWVVGCSFPGQTGPTGRRGTPGAGGAVEVRNVMGCSMAFRRDVLVATGGFGEDMGRVGTVPLGCEETELCLRLRRLFPGARIVLDPDAVVDHHVSPDRTGWRYLVRRCHAEGISKAVVTRRSGTRAGLASEQAYTRHVLPAAVARELRETGNAVCRRDRASAVRGLVGAAAIPVALAAAGTGFVRGRLSRVAPSTTPAVDGHLLQVAS